MRRFRVEFLPDLPENLLESFDVDLPPEFVQDFDKTAHVRSLEVMGQVDVNVDGRVNMLRTVGAVQNDYGVVDSFDANFLYIYLSVIFLILNIYHYFSP
jgi:hypothetical protein